MCETLLPLSYTYFQEVVFIWTLYVVSSPYVFVSHLAVMRSVSWYSRRLLAEMQIDENAFLFIVHHPTSYGCHQYPHQTVIQIISAPNQLPAAIVVFFLNPWHYRL
jgi:hypothetical protein